MKIIILEFESERISMIERALEHHHKKLKKLELEPDIVKGNDLIKRDLQKNIEVIKQVMQLFSNPNTRYCHTKGLFTTFLFCSRKL
jgi:hypothetical protein